MSYVEREFRRFNWEFLALMIGAAVCGGYVIYGVIQGARYAVAWLVRFL